MLGVDIGVSGKGDRIGAGKRMPQVGSQIRFQRQATDLVAALEPGAEAAGPGWIGIERYPRDSIVLAVEANVLMDHLRLGFDYPVACQGEGVTGLHRERHHVPLVIELEAALGMAVAVEPGIHRHRVDVPAPGVRQGPGRTEAVTSQLDLARAFAFEALVEAVDITLQAAMANEEPAALGLALGRLRGVQIVAHLEAVK